MAQPVWGVAVRKGNSALPTLLHLDDQLDTDTHFYFTRRGMPCDPPMSLPTCKIVSVKSGVVFVHPRWRSGFQPESIQLRRRTLVEWGFMTSRPTFPLPGRSATADIAWRFLLELPLQLKRNPMAAFVNMYRYRESGELLRFKGCAKS